MSGKSTSRRQFVKAAGYVAPVLLTLKAAPGLAQTGSVRQPPPPRDGKCEITKQQDCDPS